MVLLLTYSKSDLTLKQPTLVYLILYQASITSDPESDVYSPESSCIVGRNASTYVS